MGLFGKKIPVEIIIPSIAVGGFNRRVGQVKLLGGSKAARAQRAFEVDHIRLMLSYTYEDETRTVEVDELLPGDDHEHVTALMRACKIGHAEVVEVLLQAGADVNAKTAHIHENPVMMACQGVARPEHARWTHSDHAKVVRQLLARGADVNQRDNNGWSAFKWAVANGDMDIVQLLLAFPPLRLGLRDMVSAVEIARDNRHLELCDFLQQFLAEEERARRERAAAMEAERAAAKRAMLEEMAQLANASKGVTKRGGKHAPGEVDGVDGAGDDGAAAAAAAASAAAASAVSVGAKKKEGKDGVAPSASVDTAGGAIDAYWKAHQQQDEEKQAGEDAARRAAGSAEDAAQMEHMVGRMQEQERKQMADRRRKNVDIKRRQKAKIKKKKAAVGNGAGQPMDSLYQCDWAKAGELGEGAAEAPLDVGALALGKQAEGEWVKEGKNEWHFDPETFKKMAVLKAKGKVTLINDCTRERMRVFRAAQNGLAEHRRRLEAEVEEPKQLTARQREQQTWQAKRRKEREEAHADRMAAAAAIHAADSGGAGKPKGAARQQQQQRQQQQRRRQHGHVPRSIDDKKWFDAVDTVKLTKKGRPPLLAYKGSVGDRDQDYEAFKAGQGDVLEWV